MIEQLTGLEEGEFTRRDDAIRNTAEKIKDLGKPWYAASNHIIEMGIDFSGKSELFRRRTASQIVMSDFISGCTDAALVFLALVREMGVPALYVETFDKNWLSNPQGERICGHIFAEVRVKGKWRHYEPGKGYFLDDAFVIGRNEFVEAGKGVDFSELYARENGVYRASPIRVQTPQQIRDLAGLIRGN